MNALPAHFLIELALKSTAVLACAFAAMRLGRRLAAEERHVGWAAALACLLVLPVLSLAGPQLRMPAAPAIASTIASLWTRVHSERQATAAARADAGAGIAGGTERAGAAEPTTSRGPRPPRSPTPPLRSSLRLPAEGKTSPRLAPATTRSTKAPSQPYRNGFMRRRS